MTWFTRLSLKNASKYTETEPQLLVLTGDRLEVEPFWISFQ